MQTNIYFFLFHTPCARNESVHLTQQGRLYRVVSVLFQPPFDLIIQESKSTQRTEALKKEELRCVDLTFTFKRRF